MTEIPSRRSAFIQSLVEFMKRYTFDGLDMDWEYPGVKRKGGRAVDKVTFVSFLQELRSAFNAHGRGWQISLAASVVEANMKSGYDVPALCKIVDAVHLMNYNMRGAWNAFADVPSPMFPRPTDRGAIAKLNTEGGTFLWSNAGCPRYKLIVGVPFYGRELVLRNALNNRPGDPIDQEASRQLPRGGALAYSQICSQLQGNNGWARTFDDTVKCPYMTRGNRWVGYEDEESLQVKMDWIQKEGMGGAMIWAINYDDLNGDCGPRLPLISLIHRNLKDLVLVTP